MRAHPIYKTYSGREKNMMLILGKVDNSRRDYDSLMRVLELAHLHTRIPGFRVVVAGRSNGGSRQVRRAFRARFPWGKRCVLDQRGYHTQTCVDVRLSLDEKSMIALVQASPHIHGACTAM